MRVFQDRLITEEDRTVVGKLFTQISQENFPESHEQVMTDPLLIGDYMLAAPADPEAVDPALYEDCGDFEKVKVKMESMLLDYNETEGNKEMNLVLFNDALFHITKTHRIIKFPRGHALLVGYGGSGKQSLTKLSTFTAGYQIFSITLTRGYREREFREDLKKLYEILCTGPCTFLFTDAHVIEEGFLELLNNMLSIGMVPALFDDEGKKQMGDLVRDEAKKKGINESKDDLWNYFLEKVRDNLHIVMCMSPAGDTLRIRCRNFPGLVSNTGINWFFSWPAEALQAVATNYLEETEDITEFKENIISHIVMVHSSV